MTQFDVPSLIEAASQMGIPLDDQRATLLLAYLDAVLEENKSINVTAIREREKAVVMHLLDSLTAIPIALHDGAASPTSILDLGTGGGFPAVPLAIYWTDAKVYAVDGTGKKVNVVLRCCEAIGVTNVTGIHARGIEIPKLRPEMKAAAELTIARAVGPADKLVKELIPLTHRRGQILLMKGPDPDAAELKRADNYSKKRHFGLAKIHEIDSLGTVPTELAGRTIWKYGG